MQVVKIPVNDYCVSDNVLRGKACGDESKICRAVIGKKRYETENQNLLETYLKTVTEGQALSSDENTL